MSKALSNIRALKHVVEYRPLAPCRSSAFSNIRLLSTAQQGKQLPDAWFNGTRPQQLPKTQRVDAPKPHNERNVRLGKSMYEVGNVFPIQCSSLIIIKALRVLQDRLPTICQTPLPADILSPQIQLCLFPSTHPNLYRASGRAAYIAALWSSPLAWGRIPIIGNVRLEILSERMVKSPRSLSSTASNIMHITTNFRGEQLIVKWRTTDKTRRKGTSDLIDRATEFLGITGGDEFTGLFIFEFDELGRVVSHTIENVHQGGDWDKGLGAKVVGLTDWLLGGIRGRGEPGTPCPACCVDSGSRQR